MKAYKVFEEIVLYYDGYYGAALGEDKVKYFKNKSDAENYLEKIKNEEWFSQLSKFKIVEIEII